MLLIRSLFIPNFDKKLYVTYDKSWDGYRFSLSNKKLLANLVNYLNKYPLKTIKNVNYLNWLKVYKACIDKIHLTSEGLIKISKMINNFNSSTLRRKKKD